MRFASEGIIADRVLRDFWMDQCLNTGCEKIYGLSERTRVNCSNSTLSEANPHQTLLARSQIWH